jgi:hypothetical protein
MDNTVNETWINKLVDELVDAKNERSSDAVEINQFYNLLKLIFNNARLGYGGDELRLENETAIFEYLRVIDLTGYEARLNDLKAEREAEIQRLAEEKAKSKGEIKEA